MTGSDLTTKTIPILPLYYYIFPTRWINPHSTLSPLKILQHGLLVKYSFRPCDSCLKVGAARDVLDQSALYAKKMVQRIGTCWTGRASERHREGMECSLQQGQDEAAA